MRRASARVFGAGLATLLGGCSAPPPATDWPVYLGDHASSQYSALDQIDRSNVARLQEVWSYATGDASPDGRSQIQCSPLVIDGVLYGTSPALKLFALDAATGEELWRFDPLAARDDDFAMHVNRGVMYWADGGDRRIFYAAGSWLYAVDAENGTLVAGFGEAGRVSLHIGLGEGARDLFVGSNTPGVVYRDNVIIGTRVSEGPDAAPGHVRSFDARTGALRWTFHTVPRPGEPGHETWPEDAWQEVGGANAWTGFSLDEERGWVFVPTGSASADFYGANRHGENLYANSVLALDAATGERVWHFQTVRHDLWDRDLPAPPNLVTLERDGRRVEAVAQITKSGHVWVLDRESGEPLFPVEEREYPASDLEGEQAWPTQILPEAPPPFSRQTLEEGDITTRTPEAHAWALDVFRRVRSGGQFIPPSREGTALLPGFDGGGEWGGAAWDPETGLLYVNSNEQPWIMTMVDVSSEPMTPGRQVYAVHCLYCHGPELGGDPLGEYPALVGLAARRPAAEVRELVLAGKGRMPAFAFLREEQLDAVVAYVRGEEDVSTASQPRTAGREVPRYVFTGYHRFVDPDGYPAITPPWGQLTAIDLNRGEIAWQIPFGKLPELAGPPTGAENYGGPVVTAGGLLFIGASKDETFRAFDKTNGEMLWETKLPAAGYATPATYAVNGRQYVVIAAGGGKLGTRSGDTWKAFALPER